MSDAYFASGYSIKAMLRALFLSDSFKSQSSRYARIKSPAELIAGTLRLAEAFEWPTNDVYSATAASGFMGQTLLAPPRVEGWMGANDWISTGSMVQRVNFASEIMGDLDRPGIRKIVDQVKEESGTDDSPETLIDACLPHLGWLDVSDETRSELVEFASRNSSDRDQQVSSLLQLIVSTREYQLI